MKLTSGLSGLVVKFKCLFFRYDVQLVDSKRLELHLAPSTISRFATLTLPSWVRVTLTNLFGKFQKKSGLRQSAAPMHYIDDFIEFVIKGDFFAALTALYLIAV